MVHHQILKKFLDENKPYNFPSSSMCSVSECRITILTANLTVITRLRNFLFWAIEIMK